MNDTTHTQITDPYTSMFEFVHGCDDEDTVTAEPGHLYTSEDAPALYYHASDSSWWTVDEDTGSFAPSGKPENLQAADVDMSYFERWASNDDAAWAELIDDQARIDAAKESIETHDVGYAGVLGKSEDWGICLVSAGTISQVTGAVRLYAIEHGDSPEETLAAVNVKPVTRRYMSSWKIDPSTAFMLRTVGEAVMVDLTDDALGAW